MNSKLSIKTTTTAEMLILVVLEDKQKNGKQNKVLGENKEGFENDSNAGENIGN